MWVRGVVVYVLGSCDEWERKRDWHCEQNTEGKKQRLSERGRKCELYICNKVVQGFKRKYCTSERSNYEMLKRLRDKKVERKRERECKTEKTRKRRTKMRVWGFVNDAERERERERCLLKERGYNFVNKSKISWSYLRSVSFQQTLHSLQSFSDERLFILKFQFTLKSTAETYLQ